jgi:hypothetical protein
VARQLPRTCRMQLHPRLSVSKYIVLPRQTFQNDIHLEDYPTNTWLLGYCTSQTTDDDDAGIYVVEGMVRRLSSRLTEVVDSIEG